MVPQVRDQPKRVTSNNLFTINHRPLSIEPNLLLHLCLDCRLDVSDVSFNNVSKEANSSIVGIMLSRSFISAVSLLRASESRVLVAPLRSLHAMNGRAIRSASFVLSRNMSKQEGSSTEGKG